MMPKRVNYTAYAPAVLLGYSDDLRRPGGYGAGKDRVRIDDGQDHAYGPAAERLRAEVVMLRRLVA